MIDLKNTVPETVTRLETLVQSLVEEQHRRDEQYHDAIVVLIREVQQERIRARAIEQRFEEVCRAIVLLEEGLRRHYSGGGEPRIVVPNYSTQQS